MSKNASFKMTKSLLSIAIASSCLVIGQNAYAYPKDDGNGNGYMSNIGTTTYGRSETSINKTFTDNALVHWADLNGVHGPAVQIVSNTKANIEIKTTGTGRVFFQGDAVSEEGVVDTRNNAELTFTGGNIRIEQARPNANTNITNTHLIRAEDDSKMTFSNSKTVLQATYDDFMLDPIPPITPAIMALVAAEERSKITFNSELEINTGVYGDKEAKVLGIYGAGGNIEVNNKADIFVTSSNENISMLVGVQAQAGSNITFNGDLTAAVHAVKSADNSSNIAIVANGAGSKVTTNGKLIASGISKKAEALRATKGGEIEVNGSAEINADGQFAVSAINGADSKVTFNGDVSINKGNRADKFWTQYALGANQGVINVNQNGGKNVNIYGGVALTNNGTVNMKLDTGASELHGSIIELGNGGTSTLDLSNSAKWLVSATPGATETKVTNLKLSSGAVIDVTQDNDTYQNINIGNFSGNDGRFILNTDLASETDSDVLKITSSTAGATALIQVKDASLAGTQVTGVKNLLVAEDASGNVTFKGQSLNTGGLWDVTPTIENGLNAKDENGQAVGTANQWFLTKLAKALNNDTQVLVTNAHTNYGLWMNLTDTLRQRLGDVRGHGSENGSVWSRYVGGEFNDANYNVVQIGYDRAYNANSLYGVAVETGLAEGRYQYGKEKDKLMSFSLYGVWTGNEGSYVDAVAKIGRISTKLNSYGDNPDSGDFRNHAYALSVEHGKKFNFGKNQNLFVEPQVQVKFTKIGGTSYTTERGTSVHTDDVNSLVGRVGMLAGFKVENGSQFYAKFSALNEFLAKSNMSLSAANGDNTILRNRYRDTWLELGFGANIKLSDTSYFYGDVERSIKGNIDKKWQINAGLRFEF